jgi:hypothetical protein
MNDAIIQELEDEGWKAGDTNVAFQACDDSIESTGEWDEQTCRDNATAYGENSDVIGVLGTYNSGCAAEIIPILNEAPDGGVAMVSPGNTLVCLTEASAICEPDEPGVYYPSGTRNYARVVPNDAFQGAGLATFVQRQGVRNAFILYAAEDPTSKGQADTFNGAARRSASGSRASSPGTPSRRLYRADGEGPEVRRGRPDPRRPARAERPADHQGQGRGPRPNQGDGAAVQLFAPTASPSRRRSTTPAPRRPGCS